MNLLLLTIVTAWLIIAIWTSMTNRRFFWLAGFLTGVVYFTVVPIWLLWGLKSFDAIDATSIPPISWNWDQRAITALAAMLLLMLIGLHCVRGIFQFRGRFPVRWIPGRAGIKTSTILTVYLVLSFFVMMASGLGQQNSHWAEDKHRFAQEYGFAGLVLLIAVGGLKYAMLFRLLPQLSIGTPPQRTCVMLLVLVVTDLYTTGTRFFLMQTILCLGCLRCLHGERRHIIAGALLVIPVAYSMTLFTVVRTSMLSWNDRSVSSALKSLSEGVEDAGKHYGGQNILEFGTTLTESNSLNVFNHVFDKYQSFDQRINGKTLIKPLIAWVPRSLWPEKPFNFTYILGKDLVREGASLNSTVMGEPYANFGISGAIIFPLFVPAYLWILSVVCPAGDMERLNSAFCVFGIMASRNGWMEAAMMVTTGLIVLLACDSRNALMNRRYRQTAGRHTNTLKHGYCGHARAA